MNRPDAVSRVIVTSPVWSLNGVNVFSAGLVRGLRKKGIDARLLLTHPRQPDSKPMPLPPDIPIEDLGAGWDSDRSRRLELLAQYLGDNAPCIYLPNHDFEHSPACARLADGVQTIAIIHSHDPGHYSHAALLGPYCEVIVAVSEQTQREFRSLEPTLAGKLTLIPFGVNLPESPLPARSSSTDRLEIIYAGRLVKGQKRIMDLARIALGLSRRGIDFRLTIAGGGKDQDELLNRLEPLLRSGNVEYPGIVDGDSLIELYARSHVVLLTSSFEGLPLCLLEGMACGCVPVAPSIPSVAPSLVSDGHNGYVVDTGDISSYVERCIHLHRHPQLMHTMSVNAVARIKNRFSHEAMILKYLGLFDAVAAK